MKKALILISFFAAQLLHAQQNVRAWYADGQVWIVWQASFPLPETYSIYAKPSAFTNTANAILIGRSFAWEYGAGALKEQVDTFATFRIPNGQGGTYQLAENEALFVATPHSSGALWFAVVATGQTTVTPGVNITSGLVQFQYNPANDPVECHLQAVFPSPFAAGFTCFAYYMWCDGRQNQWENRPDFPVTANFAKNGMPGFFIVSAPNNIDTSHLVPLTVWLHGGGGIARQSLPGSRSIVNIKPEQGITLAQNDDLLGYRGIVPPYPDQPSWHFGYRKNYDPFSPNNIPTAPDTVVNYTQRRYVWIEDWLIKHLPVDPNRININGHSMGSAGTTALCKVFPNRYASGTAFNNGFGGPSDEGAIVVFGSTADNYPTNIYNRAGENVGFATIFNMTDNCSEERDMPIFRSYCGKNDDNGTMMWDAYVVEQYRQADSLGHGINLMWSERAHDIGGIGDHWAMTGLPTEQTAIEDVSYEEEHFWSNRSYPAFFNHRLDPIAHDPGDGTQGTGASGVGDDWGAWGGWHRSDLANIIDTPGAWSVEAWLEANAIFANDNCPENVLTADMSIRKPQQFKPITGKTLQWAVKAVNNGQVLQSGVTTVQPDNLVVIPQIKVYRENIRKVKIIVFDPALVAASEPESLVSSVQVAPNPSGEYAQLLVFMEKKSDALLQMADLNGHAHSIAISLERGENSVSLDAFGQYPAGIYAINLVTENGVKIVKWVKAR